LPALLAIAIAVAGCERERTGEPVQSVLDPASPAAHTIEWLWWRMFWICTVIFVVVVVLLTIGLLRRRGASTSTPPLGNGFIIISGIVLPAIVLVVLLVANLRAAKSLREPETDLTIRVVGKQWWWEVRYPDLGIITANELHIPVGKPVRVELRSTDVIHSFWVPRLGGKMDMIPGVQLTNYVLRADKPGAYRGQCAEFCGLQHALMAFYVIALPQEEFDEWVIARQKSPAAPISERALRGRALFASAACANCHAVAGTSFNGRIGPDLTNLASRRTIGAGILPNNRGNLQGWVSNPQPLKPGNLMPPSYLAPEELHALTDYLETLK
jgi:cytochrome c oxidase subunit 2